MGRCLYNYMKPIFKRIIHLPPWSHPAVNNPDEPSSDEQSPLRWAFVACLMALTVIYWTTHPLVARLGVWWAEVLVYAVIPIAVTFVILDRSCWHRELGAWRRVGSELLVSCAIFAGALLAMGVLISLAWFGAIAIGTKIGGR